MGWSSGALPAGLPGDEKKTPATHVEACTDRFSDGGSTPPTSTNSLQSNRPSGPEEIEGSEGGFDSPDLPVPPFFASSQRLLAEMHPGIQDAMSHVPCSVARC